MSVSAKSVGIQIAGIVVVSLIASSTIARHNAALRDGILKAALALVCLSPLAAWSFHRAGIAFWRMPGSGIRENSEALARTTEVSRLPLPEARTPTPTRSVSEELGTLARSASEESRPEPPEPARARHERAPLMNEIIIGAIAGIWALGAVILMIRLAVGVRIVARLRRDLAPFTELPAKVNDRLRRTLGATSLPPIMLSRRIGGPATLGLWRPVVVLPTDLAAKMNAEELHDALAHECAHALRRDTRIALVQQILAALFWLHPFIHILNRQLSRAREEVCDNVVLGGTPATNYARTLLSFSQTIQSTHGRIAVVPMFDPRWRLAPRVAGILNTRRNIMTRLNRRRSICVAGMAVTVGFALAAGATFGDPPKEAQQTQPSGNGRPESSSKTASGGSTVNNGPDIKPEGDAFTSLARRLGKGNKTKLGDLRFDVRKAELDVREATAALGVNEYKYNRYLEANEKTPGAIDKLSVAQAKAETDVAAVHVEQAKLSLERARTKLDMAMPALVVYMPRGAHWPDDWVDEGGMSTVNAPADFGPPFDPTDHKVTLKSFLEELSTRFKLAYGDLRYQEQRPIDVPALRVAIVRFKGSDRETVAAGDELKASDYLLARDLLDGKAKDEVIHPGDVIILYDSRWKPSAEKAEIPKGATPAAPK